MCVFCKFRWTAFYCVYYIMCFFIISLVSHRVAQNIGWFKNTKANYLKSDDWNHSTFLIFYREEINVSIIIGILKYLSLDPSYSFWLNSKVDFLSNLSLYLLYIRFMFNLKHSYFKMPFIYIEYISNMVLVWIIIFFFLIYRTVPN